jgi:nicotinate-nucleotide--dimethylbenzimidazole phosphoribosyltransferase
MASPAMDHIQQRIEQIVPLDAPSQQRAIARLADLTKPLGSLGRLEQLIIQLAGIQGTMIPALNTPAALLFAADHGVTRHGVSRYASHVTEEMAANIVMGGAVSSVLARHQGIPLRLVDVGMFRPPRHPRVIVDKAREGTQDMTTGPAMTREECEAMVDIGGRHVEELLALGVDAVVLGEMGIGNTTATAALAAVLLGVDASATVGPGTGVEADTLARKREVVRTAIEHNQPNAADPWDVMSKVGGFEIAALAGAILAAAAARVPVVLDGVTTAVAALWAAQFHPVIPEYCIASHRSAEPAHARLLEALGLEPLVDWNMRLGEGSGALLILPVLRQAAAIMAETLTFADARVSNPHGGVGAASREAPRLAEAPRAPVASDVTEAERRAVYKVIRLRRDIRSFLPDPIPATVLSRILAAAHHAPSVGLMQPWNFVVIQDRAVLAALQELAEQERLTAADNYQGIRREHYLRLKVEGLLDAPCTICVTNDPTRGGVVLGRNTIPETDLMSTACAIENMWLAARAEGLGMGWVSFYQKDDVRRVLGIPAPVEPVALLSLGYTAHFPDQPLLERVGWEQRRPLTGIVYGDRWGTPWEGLNV